MLNEADSGLVSVQAILVIEPHVPVETESFISKEGVVEIVVTLPLPTKVYQTP